MRHLASSRLVTAAALIALGHAPDAGALTREQAIEQCRNSVGRPVVMQCMQGGGGNRETCQAQARPRVQACVRQALDKANRRANVPVAAPKEQGPSEDIKKQADALPATFVAPPRTIADITAILDGEKPDPQKIAQAKAEADAPVPDKASREALARFYYQRGNARASLGRLDDAIADANKAIEAARGTMDNHLMGRLGQFSALQYFAAGDPKTALKIFRRRLRTVDAPGSRGQLFNTYRQISSMLIRMGDLVQAEATLRRNEKLIIEARTSGRPGWRKNYALYGQSWETDFEFNRAVVFEARGQFREAENAYRLAEARMRASIKIRDTMPNPPPLDQFLLGIDSLVLSQSRVKAQMGLLAEAEGDARRALLSRLREQGKYHTATPRFVVGLASVLIAQGRFDESERLLRVSLEISDAIGVAVNSFATVGTLQRLAGVLSFQQKHDEAAAIHAKIEKAIAQWEPARREAIDLNGSRIMALYNTGDLARGVATAEALVKREAARVGQGHYDTAVARGFLAIGYMKSRRNDEAAREFRAAIPQLMAGERENADDDNTTAVAVRSQRLRSIVEAYVGLLARMDGHSAKAAVESFALADTVRGRSVQQALAASSARMAVQDRALAELVRREQDLTKQVNAQLGALNNALALSSRERDENAVGVQQAAIRTLRGERDRTRAEMAKRFPSYSNLIDPKPPSVEEIKAALKPDEALLSFYFGRDRSFVWAVNKTGVMFSAIEASPGDIETKIHKLREALEPQAVTIADIPPFDLAVAYELYSLLLKPVEAGWKPAKNLIVVTNGALGLLPLSLLPTEPARPAESDEPPFAGYRGVPWLARTHAVAVVPSASALLTLRGIPAGSKSREQFIGFGDPIFSKEQAEDAAAQRDPPATQVAMATTRGIPLLRRSTPRLDRVDSAELAQLPPLPDTADELKSIALALEVDPSKVLHLGEKANESTVKSADLSRYRIIVFATHGLVPGELNGLTQPALALSTPAVAGGDGDGLLTMEEILALKLDADWIVLSACNTGSGAGAGAEAASGLGRAFFYAGTRALLVTNWSVHSQSARDLTTDLFRRQKADPGLTRGEALRQAMTALMDGPGYSDTAGKTVFTFAHPIFWAPYTIIGDGGI